MACVRVRRRVSVHISSLRVDSYENKRDPWALEWHERKAGAISSGDCEWNPGRFPWLETGGAKFAVLSHSLVDHSDGSRSWESVISCMRKTADSNFLPSVVLTKA